MDKAVAEEYKRVRTEFSEEAPEACAADFTLRAGQSRDAALWVLLWRVAHLSGDLQPILYRLDLTKRHLTPRKKEFENDRFTNSQSWTVNREC